MPCFLLHNCTFLAWSRWGLSELKCDIEWCLACSENRRKNPIFYSLGIFQNAMKVGKYIFPGDKILKSWRWIILLDFIEKDLTHWDTTTPLPRFSCPSSGRINSTFSKEQVVMVFSGGSTWHKPKKTLESVGRWDIWEWDPADSLSSKEPTMFLLFFRYKQISYENCVFSPKFSQDKSEINNRFLNLSFINKYKFSMQIPHLDLMGWAIYFSVWILVSIITLGWAMTSDFWHGDSHYNFEPSGICHSLYSAVIFICVTFIIPLSLYHSGNIA